MKQTLLFTTLLLASCNSDAPTRKTVAAPPDTTRMEVEPPAPEPTIYRTTVDELRLREAPESGSRVILKMPLGQPLRDMGERSEETFTATLNGRSVTDVWRKVSVPNPRGGKPIVGWTFGGGVAKEVIEYKPVADGRYRRDFPRGAAADFAPLVDLDLLEGFVYEGVLSYRKTATGAYEKEGPFTIKGRLDATEAAEISEDLTVTYEGHFADGKLDGRITRRLLGLENRNEAVIFFRRGRCQWGEISGEGEGIAYENREEEMLTCTFRFLEEGLN